MVCSSEFTKILLTTGWNDVGMDYTELIDMNGSCSTSLPNYPKKLSEATGIYHNNTILICGGYDGNPTNECYKVIHLKLYISSLRHCYYILWIEVKT